MKPKVLFAVTSMVTWFGANAQAAPLLNEIHTNPPGSSDERYQFIEILTLDDNGDPISETLGDVSVLVVDSNGGSIGDVVEILNLEGITTGENGVLLIGKGYDADVPFTTVSDDTAVADYDAIASAGGRGDLGPKAGMTFLLVSQFTGAVGNDLDSQDDGTLSSRPWAGILDGIGFPAVGAFETKLDVAFEPGNFSRTLGNVTPSDVSAWYGGEIEDSIGLASLSYEAGSVFGDFIGSATPGAPNKAPLEANVILINEVFTNPAGNDANSEYIELVSSTGDRQVTNGLWLLVVNTIAEEGNPGEVIEAWDLTGFSTGDNGVLLLGDNYETGIETPWGSLVSELTELADPPSMGSEDIPNDGLSLLLVRDFTGTATDTTAGTDLDPNDDGTIDQSPWDQSEGTEGILDSIGFSQLDNDSQVLTQTYALADVSPIGDDQGRHPDLAARVLGNAAANDTTAWYGGDVGGTVSSTNISIALNSEQNGFVSFGDFVGHATPGEVNLDAAPVAQPVLINEVHLDPPNAQDVGDGSREFVELISPSLSITSTHEYSVLVVDTETGLIANVFDIRDLSTGANGLLLIGEPYDTTDNTVYTSSIRSQTHREDAQGVDEGDVGPNSGIAVLLVRGFSGSEEDDLDTDDDGVLDVQPWEVLADSVGFGNDISDTTIGNLNTLSLDFDPDNISRIPGDMTPNSAEAWYGGTIEGTDPEVLIYSESFGPYLGEATPGQHSLAAPRGNSPILINEVHANPPGEDANFEFIEIVATAGGRQATNGLTLLLLETAGSGGGDIVGAWSLDGMATGSNGILLLGDDYIQPYASEDYSGYERFYWDRTLFSDVAPETPFGAVVNDEVTAIGDPIGFDPNDIGSNDSYSLVLVTGFTGQPGLDLDDTNSGTLELRPWNTLVGSEGLLDSVGIRSYDVDLGAYTGMMYALADLSQELFGPDNVSRERGLNTPNDAASWYGGGVAGGDPAGLAYGVNTFGIAGSVTPGLPNAGDGGGPDPDADDDGDGVSNEDEAIAGTDPQDPMDYLRVTSVSHSATGISVNWSSVDGKTYHIEYSLTLQGDWETITTTAIAGTDGNAEFIDTDVTRRVESQGFYRARVVVP